MSADQGSSKVLTLTKSESAPAEPDVLDNVTAIEASPAPALPTTGAIDTRTLSRSLFLRLAALAEDSPERVYVRDTLIELNLPLVRYAAARFRSRNEPMEDIVQVGTIGLIKAIDRFDCERGVEFPTFAMPTVVGEIKRFFRDTSWSVRVPRRLQELRLALTKASDELSQKLDRSPTVAELAAVLGVSEEDVVDGLAVGQRLHGVLPRLPRPRGRRRRGLPGRPPRVRGHGTGGGGVPRVAQAAPRQAPAPRAAHHHAPLLRQHDPVADRRGGRHLPDARLPAAHPDPGPAAGRTDLGLTRSGSEASFLTIRQ
ncbi:hypothetical protein GCM10010226_42150 [Streptomyces phaeofaciens]|uniref:RNA polymerase sigma-70 domain-containing protein n=1 Tax=Streptomyces phaeofaciens TaxID=68254 RepID=A0A918HF53_9ACTN|nr:hypothetical protein GCM10010226_42150 [Streptomyces phaeofaciens]